MSIDKAAVAKVSNLARIRLTDDQQESFANEISGIMKWIEQLEEVNTDGIEPLTSVTDVVACQREDILTDGNMVDAVLKNAPEKAEGFFVVPKVVE